MKRCLAVNVCGPQQCLSERVRTQLHLHTRSWKHCRCTRISSLNPLALACCGVLLPTIVAE